MFEAFINSLPEKVRCTDNPIDHGTKFRSKENALQYKYIEHNQLYKKYIIIDIDEPGSAFHFEMRGVPVPSIITINPKKGTPHYAYELNTPVIYTERARKEPQQLYEAVNMALVDRLKADREYTGQLTKNPLCPYWKVIRHNVSYDLNDFLEYVDLKGSIWRKPVNHDYDCSGRNTTTFHNLRFWAYQEVRRQINLQDFMSAVEKRAFQINDEFRALSRGPLSAREVTQIAKSVSRWTWNNRYNLDGHVQRGIMKLSDTDLALEDKQRLSAERTHKEQRNTTKSTLLASIAIMKAQGTPITQKSLEIHSKVSLSTIKRYWSEFEQMIYQRADA